VALEIDLSGRVAVVTGGSRGLGRADALALAAAGADVALVDVLAADETASEVEAFGRRALAVRCDVGARAEVERAVERARAELGAVDILVNNAGALDHLGQLVQQDDELWERDLHVNLTGAFNCARAVWPDMRGRGWGRIVNMSSVVGTLGGFGQASYAATKAGLLGLTKTLALEGGRYGITANAVVAGIIGTEAFGRLDPAMRERMERRTALRRVGSPEDVANAIAFLCSDLAAYITGAEVTVTGGIELFTF
jgi:3-oxoacyl-[acyl-carrier protein] reductase